MQKLFAAFSIFTLALSCMWTTAAPLSLVAIEIVLGRYINLYVWLLIVLPFVLAAVWMWIVLRRIQYALTFPDPVTELVETPGYALATVLSMFMVGFSTLIFLVNTHLRTVEIINAIAVITTMTNLLFLPFYWIWRATRT